MTKVLEKKIEIFAKTLRKKNSLDDTFSSLDGLQFYWTLKQTEKVLNFVPFSQSKYETTDAIRLLEDYGSRGCQVLVEGLETGRATLSVSLKDEIYTVKLVLTDIRSLYTKFKCL